MFHITQSVTVSSHVRHHRRKLTGLVEENEGGKIATQVKLIYLTVDMFSLPMIVITHGFCEKHNTKDKG